MLGMDVKSSPVKGKARDDSRWRANWWDFHPLIDNIQRPVAWSSSSTIFAAHLSQPILLGRTSSPATQFIVPSPDPVLHSPASFGPPSAIAVSPNDRWLFAFYPSRERDGVACIWERGHRVDSWLVKECWSINRGAGVVATAWAGTEREWIASNDGSCSRLPSRGPVTPVSNPTLLMVTQSQELHVCYLRTYPPSLKVLLCSLTQPYLSVEGQPRGAAHDVPSGPKTAKLCVKAAIGCFYNESSILVAMRSKRYPSSDSLKQTANDIDLGLSLDIPQELPQQEHSFPLDWGALAEDPTIELCEVKLRFDAVNMSLLSIPLPPIYHPSPHLTNLTFVSVPSPRPDPGTSPRASPRKDKQPVRLLEPAATFLVASFLDCDDYSSVPQSEIVAYSVARVPSTSSPVKLSWSFRQVGERSFSPRVLMLLAPWWSPINPRSGSVVAMVADVAGSTSRGGHRAKQVAVGSFAVFQLPDLSADSEWNGSPIMSPVGRAGMDWPVSLAISPNRTLLCAVSMTRASIHPLPKPKWNADTSDPAHLSPLTMTLVSAVVAHKSIADIAHVLSMSSTSMETVVHTISGMLLSCEINARAGTAGSFSLMEAIGVELEIYRARACQTADDDVKGFLTSLWRNAYDACSVASSLAAFEGCKGTEGYDLDVVWQLVNLSGWAVSFLENILKECLSLADLIDAPSNGIQMKPEPMDDDPFLREDPFRAGPASPLDTPILLHLVHPVLFANLVEMTSHVNRFHHLLSSLSPKEESSQMARDTLLDVVNCSGLNLEAVGDVFRAALDGVKQIPGEDARQSLAKCYPVPAQHEQLKRLIQTLCSSPAIDKPRLFIKPSDLVDAFASLAMIEPPPKEQGRDAVTKRPLLKQGGGVLCLRCGHHSEAVAVQASPGVHVLSKWKLWENLWMTRCVCGGAWMSENV